MITYQDLVVRISASMDIEQAKDQLPPGERDILNDIRLMIEYMDSVTDSIIHDIKKSDSASVLNLLNRVISQESIAAIRLKALDIMFRIDRVEAIVTVGAILDSNDTKMRGDCCGTLWDYPGADTEAIIIEHLETEQDFEVRCSMVEALGKVGLSRSIPILKAIATGTEASESWDGFPILYVANRSIDEINERATITGS